MVRTEKSLNQQSAAVYNRRLILKLLRKHRQLTRTQLAEKTRLQNSTMSYIVRDFLKRGIVVESGKRLEGSGNKKQTWLQVNPELGWVIGIVIQNVHAELVKVDYSGAIIDSCNFEVDRDISKLPLFLKDRLERWFEEKGRPPGPLKGISMGLPALVNPDSGTVVSSRFFSVKNYEFSVEMGALFPGTDIMIDNDVRQAVMAEYHHENFRHDNFLFFYSNYGQHDGLIVPEYFGTSLFINGQMISGAHGSAGELTGLLEPKDAPGLTPGEWEELKNPSGELLPKLKELADWSVPYLATLCGYSDPGAVVCGGSLNMLNREFFTYLSSELNKALPQTGNRTIQVQPSHSPVQGVAYGAAVKILDVLSDELIEV